MLFDRGDLTISTRLSIFIEAVHSFCLERIVVSSRDADQRELRIVIVRMLQDRPCDRRIVHDIDLERCRPPLQTATLVASGSLNPTVQRRRR